MACVILFPDQGSNSGPLHWEYGVLATGPPGKSLTLLCSGWICKGMLVPVPLSSMWAVHQSCIRGGSQAAGLQFCSKALYDLGETTKARLPMFAFPQLLNWILMGLLYRRSRVSLLC